MTIAADANRVVIRPMMPDDAGQVIGMALQFDEIYSFGPPRVVVARGVH